MRVLIFLLFSSISAFAQVEIKSTLASDGTTFWEIASNGLNWQYQDRNEPSPLVYGRTGSFRFGAMATNSWLSSALGEGSALGFWGQQSPVVSGVKRQNPIMGAAWGGRYWQWGLLEGGTGEEKIHYIKGKVDFPYLHIHPFYIRRSKETGSSDSWYFPRKSHRISQKVWGSVFHWTQGLPVQFSWYQGQSSKGNHYRGDLYHKWPLRKGGYWIGLYRYWWNWPSDYQNIQGGLWSGKFQKDQYRMSLELIAQKIASEEEEGGTFEGDFEGGLSFSNGEVALGGGVLVKRYHQFRPIPEEQRWWLSFEPSLSVKAFSIESGVRLKKDQTFEAKFPLKLSWKNPWGDLGVSTSFQGRNRASFWEGLELEGGVNFRSLSLQGVGSYNPQQEELKGEVRLAVQL